MFQFLMAKRIHTLEKKRVQHSWPIKCQYTITCLPELKRWRLLDYNICYSFSLTNWTITYSFIVVFVIRQWGFWHNNQQACFIFSYPFYCLSLSWFNMYTWLWWWNFEPCQWITQICAGFKCMWEGISSNHKCIYWSG